MITYLIVQELPHLCHHSLHGINAGFDKAIEPPRVGRTLGGRGLLFACSMSAVEDILIEPAPLDDVALLAPVNYLRRKRHIGDPRS